MRGDDMEHTPGPWRIGQTVQNDGSIAIMAEARIACADDFETPEGQANARLIAQAPALLAALEEIYDASRDPYTERIAQAAIKAARGEA
jgi:hypothetical protein